MFAPVGPVECHDPISTRIRLKAVFSNNKRQGLNMACYTRVHHSHTLCTSVGRQVVCAFVLPPLLRSKLAFFYCIAISLVKKSLVFPYVHSRVCAGLRVGLSGIFLLACLAKFQLCLGGVPLSFSECLRLLLAPLFGWRCFGLRQGAINKSVHLSRRVEGLKALESTQHIVGTQ